MPPANTNAAGRRGRPRRERRGRTRGTGAGYGGRSSLAPARGGKKSGRPRKARTPAERRKKSGLAGRGPDKTQKESGKKSSCPRLFSAGVDKFCLIFAQNGVLAWGGAAPAKAPPQAKTLHCGRAGGLIRRLPEIQNGHIRNDSFAASHDFTKVD
jgi:hypothetical protein